MFWRQTAITAALAVGIAAAPFSHAEARRGWPLFWPFFAGAAVLGTAAAVATAPFRYPYYGYYGRPYYAPPPAAYYPPPRAYPPGYYNSYYNGYYGAPYYYGR